MVKSDDRAKYWLLFLGYWMLFHVQALEVIRDPTRPLSVLDQKNFSKVPELTALRLPRLEAIVIKDDRKFVILGGQRYQEGDTLGAYRIEHIDNYEVHLLGESDKVSLLFYPEKVKATKDTLKR